MVETLLLSMATSAALPATGASVATASAVGATTAGSLLSGFTAVSPFLSAGFTGFSALSSITGGSQQAAVSKAQAAQYELSARQEELRGREQADQIRRSLQASLASQNAIFGARGISTRSGTPVTLGNVSRTAASRDIETAQFNSGMAAGAERLKGLQSKIEGKAYKTAGYNAAAMKLYGAKDVFGSLI